MDGGGGQRVVWKICFDTSIGCLEGGGVGGKGTLNKDSLIVL